MTFNGYAAWVKHDAGSLQREADHDGFKFCDDGTFVRPSYDSPACEKKEIAEWGSEGKKRAELLQSGVLKIPEFAIKGCEDVLRFGFKHWDSVYHEVATNFGVTDLAQTVVAAC